jgi:hypothetical protein
MRSKKSSAVPDIWGSTEIRSAAPDIWGSTETRFEESSAAPDIWGFIKI